MDLAARKLGGTFGAVFAAGVLALGAPPALAAPAWSISSSPSPGNSQSIFEAVSCVSAKSCEAVGWYVNTDGSGAALAVGWNGKSWVRQTVPVPDTAQGVELFGVSCVSATDCTASGTDYDDSSTVGEEVPLIETWNGSSWTYQKPPTNPTGEQVWMYQISCASGGCTSVGYVTPTTSTKCANTCSIALAGSGSSWKFETPTTPTGYAALYGVSCLSAGPCESAGWANGSSAGFQTLAELDSAGAWTTQTTPGSGGAQLFGVSCVSSSDCIATGWTGADTSLAESFNGKTWSVSSTPSPGYEAVLGGVSCTAGNACTATGYYQTTGSVDLTLAELWDGSTWTVENTPNPAGTEGSELQAASCTTTPIPFCAAVGFNDAKSLIEVQDAPTVTSVAPNAGSTAGANTVVIDGTNFRSGATVAFGSTRSSSVTYVSSTELKAVVPAEVAGVVNVTVTTDGLTSATSSGDLYAYGPPKVSSFTPTSGITGSSVTITGSGFVPHAAAKFGSLSAPSVTFVSPTELKAIVPNGAVPGPISVTTAAGSAPSSASFTPTLSITGLSPADGPVGTSVTISGVGFNSSSSVKFNGTAATVTSRSSTQLKANVPTGATSGAVTVTNSSAPTGTVRSASSFTVS